MGVSTSIKSLLSRYDLISLMILVLFLNKLIVTGFEIKSKDLCLYLSSVSLKSSCDFPSASVFTIGSGFMDLERRVSFSTKTGCYLNYSVPTPFISPQLIPILGNLDIIIYSFL